MSEATATAEAASSSMTRPRRPFASKAPGFATAGILRFVAGAAEIVEKVLNYRRHGWQLDASLQYRGESE